jgi:hypothetical protein
VGRLCQNGAIENQAADQPAGAQQPPREIFHAASLASFMDNTLETPGSCMVTP